ncbi:hypothetical protein ACCO45_006279 [Purpureocillium lilacinum]|uniref:Uncharacterized protein n=1 Tax=Purpureocillium lilacinum TaxID=33203 RepID=A0ACC4DXT2_PURLI
MSVFFKDISPGNPVRTGDVEKLLEPLGLTVSPDESADYTRLLAAVHDCAERVSNLPDYQPVPDTERFRRHDIHLPTEDEQAYGHAWAHRFIIRGDALATSNMKGKQVCVKDCIAVANVPQFFGSDAFPAWTPAVDATVVTRVLEAGADIVGTATLPKELSTIPIKLATLLGGSTSGGAALVAGGLVDVAIGTDQGGSIRVPASLCGCVGFKPTHGLVPYTGITSGDQIDDHAGPIARSVDEIADCLDTIAGYDGVDDRSLAAPPPGSLTYKKSLKSFGSRLDGVRVAVLKEGYDNDLMQPGVRRSFLEAVKRIETLGGAVKEVSIPLHKEGPSIWTIQQRISGTSGILGHANGRRGLYLTEFEHARLPWTAQNFDKLFPSTKNTVINGLYLTHEFPGLYAKTVNIGRRIADAYETTFKEYDSFEPSMGMTVNTAVFNVTGHPALSLPIGWSEAVDDDQTMLPVGMQIVGGLWQETQILRVAKAVEQSFDWKFPYSLA